MITAALSATFAMGIFGALTQRTLLGLLVSLQVLYVVVCLCLVLLFPTERARDMALLILVFSQLQALGGLAFVIRAHYLKSKGKMRELEHLGG